MDGRSSRVLTSIAAALLAVCGGAAAHGPAAGPRDLAGTWRAEAEHAGATGEIVLRFDRGGGGDLSAVLSLPTIDAWEVAALPVAVDSAGVDLGLFALRWNTDGTLSGVMPEALVPVHRIPITFRRADAVGRPAPTPTDAPGAEPEWTKDLQSPVWAGLAFADGAVFAGADNGAVRALNARTGEDVWRFDTGGPIRGRPTPTRGDLYVHSDDGFLYALDLRSGERKWRARVEAAPVDRHGVGEPGSRYDHFASSAVRSGATVFVGSHDGAIHAVDAETGAPRWKAEVGDAVSATPVVDGDRVVFGSFDGRIYALDAATGEEMWHHDTHQPVPAQAAVAGNLLVAGSRSYELIALEAANGRRAWTHYVWYSWIESPPTVFDGAVYVGSSDTQALSALDAAGGELIWSFDLGGSGWGQPAVTGTAVFLGAVGVADYMVDHRGGFWAVDRESGEALWHVPFERGGDARVWGVAASPAVGGGRVFVADLDGRVMAFPQGAPK